MTDQSNPISSNLKKIDTHVVASAEYDEIPELTDGDLNRARLRVAGSPVAKSLFVAAVRERLGKRRTDDASGDV